MKIFYVLLALATIAAATLAAYVPNAESSSWPHWVALIPIGVVGWIGLMIRKEQRSAHAETAASDDRADFASAAEEIHKAAAEILESLSGDAEDTPELRQRARDAIDHLEVVAVTPIVEQRQSLAMQLGLGNFANLMSEFARGERALHRAWSALTDDHLPEAQSSLAEAVTIFASVVEQAQASGARDAGAGSSGPQAGAPLANDAAAPQS